MSGDRNKLFKKKAKGEDKRLKNYSSWVERWKNVQHKISEKVNVTPENLLANCAEGIKQVNEEKMILQYAKIPTEFDKYRGKPDFWKLPVSLSRKFPNCRNEPYYFAVQTKEEKYIVPSLELTGIPEFIKNERSVMNGAKNIYKRWVSSKYRNQQMEKFASKINAICPHRPSFEQLIVVGRQISLTDSDKVIHQTPRTNHSEKVDDTTKVDEHFQLKKISKPQEVFQTPRLSLRVNGILLDRLSCKETGSRKLRINFEYDVSSLGMCENFLYFENNGLATLRISWNRVEKFRLFRDFTEEKWEKHGFFFNKSDLLLLPGEKIKFPVWFQTENAGTYSENWELNTNPKIWGDDFKVNLVLHSYAYYKDLKEKVDRIIKDMDIKVRNMLIKDVIRGLVDQLKYEETPVAPCIYEEGHLFEIANLTNGRPKFLYDKIIIEELKQFYDKVTTELKDWDYSINHLKQLSQEKDVTIYHDIKKRELEERIEKIKSGKIEEPTSAKEKSPSKTNKDKKSKTIKDKVKKIKGFKNVSETSEKNTSEVSEKNTNEVEVVAEEIKENYVYSNQLECFDIVKKLDSPVIVNSKREKLFSCTKVMVAYFNKMCHLLESLEKDKEMKNNTKYPGFKYKLTPINEQPERLIYEYFEDHYIVSHPPDIYTSEAKPKSKILKNIPNDDVEMIYSTYFCINSNSKKQDLKTNEGNKKAKKGKEKLPKDDKAKSKKGQALSKLKNRSNSLEQVNAKTVESVECFNPYAEIFTYAPYFEDTENIPIVKETTSKLSKQEREEYKYQQYVTVYSCLSEAVDALVDTVESFDCVVSHSTLNEVKALCDDSIDGKK